MDLAAMLFIAFGIGLYFLPLIIAVIKNKRNMLAISMLNLFAGWTLLGWIAALVWACLEEK
ncbi:superinfection immunity protein [Stutzerimonas xanthomarina]|uniref:superinfection immunity protein n=1 Tax=Stutzerimonas xanthomarina TaxID=271420 RepID=UPI003AA90088